MLEELLGRRAPRGNPLMTRALAAFARFVVMWCGVGFLVVGVVALGRGV
jgi:hypothetical protein